jgi:hypothetical protein
MYNLGDNVEIDVELFNSGAPQDVNVYTNILQQITNTYSDELPTQRLTDISDTQTLSLDWDSTGNAPGLYEVEVIVKNSVGQKLDQCRTPFRLGNVAGEVTDFNVTPQHFVVHDNIKFMLEFENTGDCEYDAQCVFHITTEDDFIDEFTLDPETLGPGTSKVFQYDWDTSGTEKNEIYYVVGAVHFEGMVSEARSALCSTNLMPIPGLNITPDTAKVGEDFVFDASPSNDPDGSIVSYYWEFDDDSESDDCMTTHKYYQSGEYNVTLTVTDEDGGTSSVSHVIQVTSTGSGILLSGIDFLKPGTLDYPPGALSAESDNGIELVLSDNKERKPADNRMVGIKPTLRAGFAAHP